MQNKRGGGSGSGADDFNRNIRANTESGLCPGATGGVLMASIWCIGGRNILDGREYQILSSLHNAQMPRRGK